MRLLNMTNQNLESRFTESEFNNLSLIKRLFSEVWNARHVDIVPEILSPDVILQYDQGELKGITKWKEKFYKPIVEAFPDVRLEIEDIVADGDLVVTRWKARGTLKGTLFGVLPTDEVIEFKGTSWMKVFEGKIVAMWTHWDVSYLIQQLHLEVKKLKSMLPICSKCKKIRNDQGYWKNIESYIEHHSDMGFSHGLCPECLEALYGEQEWYKKGKKKGKF